MLETLESKEGISLFLARPAPPSAPSLLSAGIKVDGRVGRIGIHIGRQFPVMEELSSLRYIIVPIHFNSDVFTRCNQEQSRQQSGEVSLIPSHKSIYF